MASPSRLITSPPAIPAGEFSPSNCCCAHSASTSSPSLRPLRIFRGNSLSCRLGSNQTSPQSSNWSISSQQNLSRLSVPEGSLSCSRISQAYFLSSSEASDLTCLKVKGESPVRRRLFTYLTPKRSSVGIASAFRSEDERSVSVSEPRLRKPRNSDQAGLNRCDSVGDGSEPNRFSRLETEPLLLELKSLEEKLFLKREGGSDGGSDKETVRGGEKYEKSIFIEANAERGERESEKDLRDSEDDLERGAETSSPLISSSSSASIPSSPGSSFPLLVSLSNSESSLSDDDYFDKEEYHLASVQVKRPSSSTPAFPRALTTLYLTYFFNCFSEHAWRFIWPAVVALMHESLLPVAVASFASQLFIFFAAPWVGDVLDSMPRVKSLNILSIAQCSSTLVSSLALIYGMAVSESLKSTSANSLLTKPWFVLLVVAGSIERLSGLASGVAFERDWVVKLAGNDRPLALAKANAMMRRVDLITEITGPLMFGWILSQFQPLVCMKIFVAVLVFSLPFLLGLLTVTDFLSNGVLRKKEMSLSSSKQESKKERRKSLSLSASPPSSPSPLSNCDVDFLIHSSTGPTLIIRNGSALLSQNTKKLKTAKTSRVQVPATYGVSYVIPSLRNEEFGSRHRGGKGEKEREGENEGGRLRIDRTEGESSKGAHGVGEMLRNYFARFTAILPTFFQGWRFYLSQAVLPASLAYVLLHFNAVLSPGGLMTSFLTQKGIDVSVIGLFRGACALTGFLATFASAPLISSLGVLNSGLFALLFQSALLLLSVGLFYLSPAQHSQTHLMLFLVLVAVSRLGHWVYDVITSQIFQTAIHPSQANSIGTTEVALSSLAELIMLFLAVLIHDVKHFGVLAAISMASVFSATAIYCLWLSRPNREVSRLFPYQPSLGEGMTSLLGVGGR